MTCLLRMMLIFLEVLLKRHEALIERSKFLDKNHATLFWNCQKWRRIKSKCHPKFFEGYFFSVQQLMQFFLVWNCLGYFTWFVVWWALVKKNLKCHLLCKTLLFFKKFSFRGIFLHFKVSWFSSSKVCVDDQHSHGK